MPEARRLAFAKRAAGGPRTPAKPAFLVGFARPTLTDAVRQARNSSPLPSEPPSPKDHDEPERDEKRIERALREAVRKVIEAGYERLSEGPESVRHLMSELKLPKETLAALFGTFDDTKNGLYRVVAREVRDFLEHSNLAEDIVRGLTALSFEIKTEVRFIPNDARPNRPTPDVRSKVSVKRSSAAPPPSAPAAQEGASHPGASDKDSDPSPES
jgi:hypothetical protein